MTAPWAPVLPGRRAAIEGHQLIASGWTRALALLAAAIGLIGALFWSDVAAMVAIWWDSSTFNHCLLLVPIIGWLVAQRVPVLRGLSPSGWWPGLIPTAALAALWLTGELAGLALFRQAAVVGLAVAAVVTILGPTVARALAFPLFYMAFLIPAGEELVPLLQTITAAMSMLLLDWTGIPAHIDGVFITTPNGYFEVAEACSGVKFLIAMAAYAVLVAHLCFKRWWRRALFLAFALVVPVVANGVRAFGTIWIADRIDIGFAASFDHVFYGWVFFGLVILLVMAAAYPFFDRPADAQPVPPRVARWMTVGAINPFLALAGFAMLIAAPPVWARMSEVRAAALAPTFALTPPPGWRVDDRPAAHSWTPHFAGATLRHQQRWTPIAGGPSVDIAVAAFAVQTEGRELIGFGQGAAGPDSPWQWSATLPAIDGLTAERLVRPGPIHRIALTLRVIDGQPTAGGLGAKWLTLRSRLPGHDPLAYAVVMSAVEDDAGTGRDAATRLLRDLGGERALARSVGQGLRTGRDGR